MKYIKLHNSDKKVMVDDEDFPKLNKYTWGLKKDYCGEYAQSIMDIVKWPRLMHRAILNRFDKVLVIHKDGNGLNNKKSNLSLATPQQKQAHATKRAFATSEYKGIYWNKERNKWRASIMFNYKKYNLGNYDSEVEAAKAYDARATELFGRFANLNFPKGRI